MGKNSYTVQYKVLASTYENRLCYAKGHLWMEDAYHNKNDIESSLSILSKCRIIERALRLTPRVGFTLKNEFYFTLHGYLFHVDQSKMKAVPVYQFRVGMNNPLTICKCKLNQHEAAYWGEYWPNQNQEEVSVFSFDGDSVTKVCSLSGIKHVHTIAWDQYRECFWIATGDDDDESRIYKASRDFDCLEIAFSGKQIYRTCALFPLENGLLYATDSPISSNSLLFSKSILNELMEPVVISAIPGPCIFSQEFDEKYYFSTSVESNPNQNIVKYWLSRKIGPGNMDKRSYVICVDKDLQIKELFHVEKDRYNMATFQFGTIQLTYDAFENSLAAYCTALMKFDGRTIYLAEKGE